MKIHTFLSIYDIINIYYFISFTRGIILVFWKIFFLCASLILNICAFPAAMFLGTMATDAPGSGLTEFSIGFFMIQGIPLILLIISIFCLVRKPKSNQKAN